jgi:hypothetical protein
MPDIGNENYPDRLTALTGANRFSKGFNFILGFVLE